MLLALVAVTVLAAFPDSESGRDEAPFLRDAALKRTLAAAGGFPALDPFAGLAVGSFDRDTPGRYGVVIAPLAGGRPVAFGGLRSGQAWSAIKVPLAAAYLDWRRRIARARHGSSVLRPGERARLRVLLTRSDNDAARALFRSMSAVEGQRGARLLMERMLRRAGDRRTRVASPFGTTHWRLDDAALFFAALGRGCLLTGVDTDTLLGLMRSVIPEQRWGIPAAAGSVPVAFKGGWGQDSRDRWLVEQFAIVGGGDSARVVGLMTQLDEGGTTLAAFARATAAADRVARLVKTELRAAGSDRGAALPERCGRPGARGEARRLAPLARLRG